MKIPVTLHLTQEAAHILKTCASDRGRGQFVSELIMHWHEREEMKQFKLLMETGMYLEAAELMLRKLEREE